MSTAQERLTSTADLAATLRAWHQRDRVRLVKDPHAASLTSPALRRILRFRPATWFLAHWLLGGLKPVMLGLLIRARYAEQAVEAAFRDGIRQYVIVGAGLDSFALRRGDLVPPLRVFEIDRPAMQAVKRERVRRARIPLPSGLHFVPADLEQVSVMDALANSVFDPRQRTIVSFLGVTYYLSPETLAESARSIAGGRRSRLAARPRLHAGRSLRLARAPGDARAARSVRGEARGAHEERIQPRRDERPVG